MAFKKTDGMRHRHKDVVKDRPVFRGSLRIFVDESFGKHHCDANAPNVPPRKRSALVIYTVPSPVSVFRSLIVPPLLSTGRVRNPGNTVELTSVLTRGYTVKNFSCDGGIFSHWQVDAIGSFFPERDLHLWLNSLCSLRRCIESPRTVLPSDLYSYDEWLVFSSRHPCFPVPSESVCVRKHRIVPWPFENPRTIFVAFLISNRSINFSYSFAD